MLPRVFCEFKFLQDFLKKRDFEFPNSVYTSACIRLNFKILTSLPEVLNGFLGRNFCAAFLLDLQVLKYFARMKHDLNPVFTRVIVTYNIITGCANVTKSEKKTLTISLSKISGL